MKTVIYPGHFNPITNGHTDLIQRALRLFDQVVVAIGFNPRKTSAVSLEDRASLCRKALAGLEGVEVEGFDCLLVDYARRKNARFILRGLRNVADFEYEFQMLDMNRNLSSDIDYVFLAPSQGCSFISSSLVREIAAFGGDISKFVPPVVAAAYGKSSKSGGQD